MNDNLTTYPRINIGDSGWCYQPSKPRVAGKLRKAIILNLTEPKNKHTNRGRKTLRAMLDYTCAFNTATAIAAPVRFARKLTGLKLAQLIRRQRQWARRASTALHLARKLSPESVFRRAIEQQHLTAINCFKQVNAEILARKLACEGKLAEAA